MLVRSFQLADYRSVTQILADVLSETCYEETMNAFARQLSFDSDLVLIAEEQGEVFGVIIGTIDNNKAYYYRVAVHADYQRRGIGKALIEAMKKRFLQRKVSRVLVNVDVHNEPFLPVWESAGFQAIDFSRTSRQLRISNA